MRASVTLVTVVMVSLLCPGAARSDSLNASLKELGLGIAKAVDQAGLKRVGVPEFSNAAGGLGGDVGAAGHYVAERIEEGMFGMAGRRFSIVERRRLNTVLQEARIQSSGLTDEQNAGAICGKIQGLDTLIVGTIARTGHTVHVSAKVVRLPDAEVQGVQSAEVKLDPDLLALFGTSVALPTQGQATPPKPEEVVSAALAPSAAPRPPQLDAGYPYRMEILVDSRPKPIYQRGNDLLTPANPGETYQIRLTNRAARPVAVALLIDGLSSIGAKREIPGEARKWIVRPGQSTTIPGWQMANDHARRFVFVGSGESLAARMQYADQVGLITAAFYPEATSEPQTPPKGLSTSESRGGLGTGSGERVESGISYVAFKAAPAPAAILTIRYDAAAEVEKHPRVTP